MTQGSSQHFNQELALQGIHTPLGSAFNPVVYLYDKESGEGYKSVPLRHQNSDASQDALKLVPDSSF